MTNEQKIRAIAASTEWTGDMRVNFNAVMAALRGAVLLLDGAARQKELRDRTIAELRGDLKVAGDEALRLRQSLNDIIQHQETVGGSMSERSSTLLIARSAVKERMETP